MNKSSTEHQLSDILRMLMTRAGIQSDNELADRLEAFENGQCGPAISQPTISRILNGSTRDPRAETVRRLGRYFDVTEAQMRGLDPIHGLTFGRGASATVAPVGEATPQPYALTSPPGEPGAGECLELLGDFARLPAVQRLCVTKLARDLRNREITKETPLYTLEEISRAVQAVLFTFGTASAQLQEHEMQHTFDEISGVLRMQKPDFFVSKKKNSAIK